MKKRFIMQIDVLDLYPLQNLERTFDKFLESVFWHNYAPYEVEGVFRRAFEKTILNKYYAMNGKMPDGSSVRPGVQRKAKLAKKG